MQRSIMPAIVALGLSSLLFAQQDKNESSAKGSAKKKKDDDAITMTVVTKTGSLNKNARADAIKIFVLLNGDTDHKTRLKDPKKDNFELGATDKFQKIPVKLPLDQITSIRLAVEGDDMWKCETISFQFFQGESQSKLYKFSPGRYLSAGKERKGYKAVKLLDFKLNPAPKLAPPDSSDEEDSEKPSKSGDKGDKSEKKSKK